jgi:voltage-dependent calcium channel alpha-2/delta-4
LDVIFKQNYFSDPALSFQYFGSSLGVMRSYPGEQYYLFCGVTDLMNVG